MSKTLNTIHFLYAFVIVIFLTSSAFVTAFTNQNYLTPLLFLPIFFYFLISFYHRFYNWSLEADRAENFHFLLFITQNNPLYLITLGLLILAFTLSIIKGLLLS